MPRQESIRGEREYDAIFRTGRKAAGERLTVRALRNGLDINRYGFVVGRRVGTAVVRNRVRRRLRHALDDIHSHGGWDIAVVAHPPASQAPYNQLRADLDELLARVGVATEITT